MTKTTKMHNIFTTENFHKIVKLAIALVIIRLTISFFMASDSATFLNGLLPGRLPSVSDSPVLAFLFHLEPETMDPTAELAVNSFIHGFTDALFAIICGLLDGFRMMVLSIITSAFNAIV